MRHLMSPLDFTVEEIDKLLDLASDIEAHPDKYAHACEGKKLATLFYEPSTRTRLSHEAAMLNLGGSVLGFSSAASSSATKGETVADTIRMISCFADIPDADRPYDNPLSERQTGPHEDRSLRRLEIWTYRTFTDPCTGALSGNRIRPYFSGRTSSSKLHATGCTG